MIDGRHRIATDTPWLVDRATLAQLHDVCPRTISYWMRDGTIRCFPLPGRVSRFDPLEVERALLKFEVPATPCLTTTVMPAGIDPELLLGDEPLDPEVAFVAPDSGEPRIRQWMKKGGLAHKMGVSTRLINYWMAGHVIPFRKLPNRHPRFCLDDVRCALGRLRMPPSV